MNENLYHQSGQLNRHNGVSHRSAGDERPLVSIITPFLNVEKFLQEAIESILAQSYDHWELLLVDDGSSDRGPEIARHYAAQYPAKIRWLEHDGHAHRGAAAARNLGIRHAQGRYITFLDADDIYLPGKLEKEVDALGSQPEAAAVCGSFQFWYSWTGDPGDAQRDFIYRLGVEPGRLHHPPHLFIHFLRTAGRKPHTSGIMIRRETISSVGAFEPETFMTLAEDNLFWVRVSLNQSVFVTDECLLRYRQHPDSTCAVAIREGRMLAAKQSLLRWLAEYLTSEGVKTPEVWKALKSYQKAFHYRGSFAVLRRIVQRVLRPKTRYWLRDKYIKLRLIGT